MGQTDSFLVLRGPVCSSCLVNICIAHVHVTTHETHVTNTFHLLQTSNGPWHLQSIEVLEKPLGRVYYFPCPQWLDRASSTRLKLSIGQKPARFTPALRAAPAEEEDWQALVPAPAEAPAELQSEGVGGSYTVSCDWHL